MARWKDFIGSIFIGSGMKPKGDYPLMDAHDIVTEDGTRLDEKLKNISTTSTVDTVYDDKTQSLTIKGGTNE